MKLVQSSACVAILTVFAIFRSAIAQTNSPEIPPWAIIVHRLALQAPDPSRPRSVTGVFPGIIPEYLPSLDPSGAMETFNLAAPTDTETNAFFQSLGTNGRA